MTNTFKDYMIGFILAGLFLYCLIAFAVNAQLNNDVAHPITEDSRVGLVYSNLQSNLSGVENTANSSRTNFEQDTPTAGVLGFSMTAIVGVGKTLTATISNMYNITLGAVFGILGIPTIVLQVIGSILVLFIVLLLWRLYRVGE